MARRPPPKIVVEKHEGYRSIIESGIFGGHRPGFFEWIIYTDKLIADDALATIPPDPAKTIIKRTLQCRLVLTAFQAKTLAGWLNKHIGEYEKKFGKIITPQEMGKKGKGPPPSTYV